MKHAKWISAQFIESQSPKFVKPFIGGGTVKQMPSLDRSFWINDIAHTKHPSSEIWKPIMRTWSLKQENINFREHRRKAISQS